MENSHACKVEGRACCLGSSLEREVSPFGKRKLAVGGVLAGSLKLLSWTWRALGIR
jgi:hypothetical protein